MFHQDQGCQVYVGEIRIKYRFLCSVEERDIDRDRMNLWQISNKTSCFVRANDLKKQAMQRLGLF